MRVIAATTRKRVESTANGMGRGGSREEEGLAPVPRPGPLPGEFQQNTPGCSKHFGVRPERLVAYPQALLGFRFLLARTGKSAPLSPPPRPPLRLGRALGIDTGTGPVCPTLGLGPLYLSPLLSFAPERGSRCA